MLDLGCQMMKNCVWDWVRSVATAAALGLSIAGAAHAAAPPTQFAPQLAGSTQAGGSFTLWWIDETLPFDGPTSFTDGDVWLAYDASVLTLNTAGAGSIFNGALASPAAEAGQAAQYDWLGALTLRPFTIAGGTGPGAATFQDVFFAEFEVNLSAPGGETVVYFLPDQIAVQNNFGSEPNSNYYAFAANVGYAVGFDITPVPEPASLALLLAGLGVVAGAAARRSRRTAPAA